MFWWVILALTVVIMAAPHVAELLRPRLGEQARQNAPGELVKLKRGVTHYRWLGAETGPVAVCVHGLTTSSYVWEPVARGLGEMGFRVLLYDLYGRGYSARPRGEQDSRFFVEQLEGLLAHLDLEDDITLLGYSMGGAIAPAFGAKHHKRLRQMVLIAPAGTGHDLGPIARLACNHRWLGKWLALLFYPRSLRQATEAERGLKCEIEGMVDLQIAETRWRGFAPAVLSSLQGILDENLEPSHRVIAEAGLPVLAIWGKEDEIIPLSGRETLADWNGSAQSAVIDGAGHTLTYTNSAAVIEHLEWLDAS